MASPWTRRLAFAVSLLFGLTGCPDNGPEDCFPPPPSIQQEQPGIVLVGRQVRLNIRASSSLGCDSAFPKSVTAEIEGPDGARVANQIELAQFSSSAVLQFTPERPGPYHLLVAFSPEGGIQQFDLNAGLDRSAEAPSHTLSKTCENVERTLQGAWVCDTSVLRGSTLLGSFEGSRLAEPGTPPPLGVDGGPISGAGLVGAGPQRLDWQPVHVWSGCGASRLQHALHGPPPPWPLRGGLVPPAAAARAGAAGRGHLLSPRLPHPVLGADGSVPSGHPHEGAPAPTASVSSG
jgi:hypothetical protein